MISLTYLSTATLPYTQEQLTELLAASRERNHADDLSGMLLYAGGHFIQTLEGPEENVDATFARIERDSRHRNIYIALREPIDERVFPDWSMGFENLSPEDAQTLPGFNDFLAGHEMSAEDRKRLGRAGVFHRVFKNNML